MVATFNGWDDMPEAERESLEQWEREHEGQSSAWALPTRLLGLFPVALSLPVTAQ